MRLGYNTNGLAHHHWRDALELVASAGYQSVAITIDHHCLNPFAPTFSAELKSVATCLQQLGLRSVIETGARFLLDPAHKHAPTLLTADPVLRERRLQFLKSCVQIAAELNSDAVSFWAGIPIGKEPAENYWERLRWGCRELAEFAAGYRQRLAFEPEPGMLVETCDQFQRLVDEVELPNFGLTLDVGHVHCLQDGQIADRIREHADRLWNVHLEDMQVGVHEHLPFGRGSIDFPPIFQALEDIQYRGGLHVELSRDSHRAPTALQESFAFLQAQQEQIRSRRE